jgi:hypothetical protein
VGTSVIGGEFSHFFNVIKMMLRYTKKICDKGPIFYISIENKQKKLLNM